MDLKARASKIKTDIPTVFIALKKKETPMGAKILAVFTVAYALSPIDIIPDFIPVLGYLDDAILLPFFVAMTIRLIPKEVIEECRIEAEGLWVNGKLKKWYYAVPIILFWFVAIFLIVREIW